MTGMAPGMGDTILHPGYNHYL